MKEMFGMIFEKLDSMDRKFGTMDEKIDIMDKKIGTMDEKVDTLDEKFGTLDKKFDTLDRKVTRNSVDIESIKSDIKTIVEVQKAYMDKNERDHEKIITLINDGMSLHSAILKNLSSDVRGLEENQKILEREVASIKRKIG